jgi:IS5 family transposase
MIDLRHPLAVLAQRMPWDRIEEQLSALFAHRDRPGVVKEVVSRFGPTVQRTGSGVSNAGRPRFPTRLMVALLYLKHAYNESDESLVERWSQDMYFQYFSGMAYFEPRFPCDATQIGRFRTAIGEAGVEAVLKATIDTAVSSKAIKPEEFERVIVDTTVQEKAVAFPTDSRLLEIARYQVVKAAKAAGVLLKQTLADEGPVCQHKLEPIELELMYKSGCSGDA